MVDILASAAVASGSVSAPGAGASLCHDAGESQALLDVLCALGPIGCRRSAPWMGSEPAQADVMASFGCVVTAQTYSHQRMGDGTLERIRLEGPAGTVSLHLLPDTDFLAWDELLALLEVRLPRRAGCIRPDRGRLAVCRFEPIAMRSVRVVPLQPAALSACGRCVLELIAAARSCLSMS